MHDERRRSIRAEKPLTVEYCFSARGKPLWHTGLLRDISDRGLCMSTEVCACPGQTVRLRIRLTGRPRRQLILEGAVVRAARDRKHPGQAHIRFRHVSGRAQALLREYIAWVLVNERGA